MSASPKQIKLIEDMQAIGAPIPATNDYSVASNREIFASVQAADAYIKQNLEFRAQLIRRASLKRWCDDVVINGFGPGDWGGIPNS